MKAFRIGCISVILVPAFTLAGMSQRPETRRPGVMARVVSVNGVSRTVRLEGVGCSESICSRVFIRNTSENGTPQRTWFDSITAIRDTTERDALFVMKDGSRSRLGFVSSFRVLYLSGENGRTEKLDLSGIRSLEFLGFAK